MKEDTKFYIKYPAKEFIVIALILLSQPLLLFLLPNNQIVITWVILAAVFFVYHLLQMSLTNILRNTYILFNEEGVMPAGPFGKTKKYLWKDYNYHNGYIIVENLIIIQFGKKRLKILNNNLTNGNINDILKAIKDNKVKYILKNFSGEDAIIEIYNLLSMFFYSDKIELEEYEKNIVYIEELDTIINSGGFSDYFFYPQSDNVIKALNALEAIGSKKFLEILRKAINKFPNATVPKSLDERQITVNKMEAENPSLWNDLDNEFLEYTEGIYDLLIKYITKNINEFR